MSVHQQSTKIFCIDYVNDVIWAAPDHMRISRVLEFMKDELEMTVEGDVTSFPSIKFKHLPSGKIMMQQLGLIERVLKTTGVQDCNPD